MGGGTQLLHFLTGWVGIGQNRDDFSVENMFLPPYVLFGCTYTTAALSSMPVQLVISCIVSIAENRLEGWLSVPKKQNIKRHGWTKQYVVVSSKKILFYDSENSKQNADPARVLDIE